MTKLKIGNVELENPLVLAPMAGISNSAYRTIIKDMGCGLIYAEMVSAAVLDGMSAQIAAQGVKVEEMVEKEDAKKPARKKASKKAAAEEVVAE